MNIVRILAATLALTTGASVVTANAFDPIISIGGQHNLIHPAGETSDVLATKEQTDGKFGAIILGDKGAGAGPGPAIIHTLEDELWFVLEGTYEFHVGDQTFEGGPGTFVAAAAGQPHGFITKSPGRLLTIYLPGGYEHFFMDWAEQGLTPGPELDPLEDKYGVTRP